MSFKKHRTFANTYRQEDLRKFKANVNQVFLIGTVYNDVKLYSVPSGECFVQFLLITQESWTDKRTGKQVTHTEYHKITSAHSRIALRMFREIRKGSQLCVFAKLKNSEYGIEIVVHGYEKV